jgi:hypothetical protein
MKDEQLAMALLKMMVWVCVKEGFTCFPIASFSQKAFTTSYSSFLPLNLSS